MLLLAARPVGLPRPAHAVEFLEDEDTLVSDTLTLCDKLRVADTDFDPAKPQPFGAVPPDETCAVCARLSTLGRREPIPVVPSPGPI